jgi:hypothetical protein
MQCAAEFAARAHHRMRTYRRSITIAHWYTYIYTRPILMYIYVYNICPKVHIYCTYTESLLHPRSHTNIPWKPAHASARTCSHARAHRRRRRAQPAAPHRSPAERVRHCARRPGRKGAYIGQVHDTRGVPRADVRVERRSRLERLRAEAARGPRRRDARARFERRCVRAETRPHPRARTSAQHVRASGAHARIGDPTLHVATRRDVATCN